MPSDANGVHNLPNGYLAEDGDTIQPSQHNPPLEDLSAGLTERLMRSGVAPMTGPLKLADGNSGAPGLTFNSDPSAGFYLENGKIKFTKPIVQKEMIGLGPLPWPRLTAPPNWVLCYGQTLSRTAYADLWTVAQAEIAAGNTLFNNGDGSTTFGIMDMRGCVWAASDALGGFAAGRLTGAFGATIGSQSVALLANEIPPVSFSGVTGVDSPDHTHNYISSPSQALAGTTGTTVAVSNIPTNNVSGGANSRHAHAFSGTINGGGQAHNNVQPTRIGGAILYAGA